MPRQITELNGMTSTGVYKDGEMSTLVNMRKKGGVMRPVSPIGRMAKYYQLAYDNIIFVPAWSVEAGNKAMSDRRAFVGLVYTSDTTKIYFDEAEPFVLGDRITDIRVQGMIITFVGLKGVYYGKITALWSDVPGGSGTGLVFTFLGALPECPVIKFAHASSTKKVNDSLYESENQFSQDVASLENDKPLWDKAEELYNLLINNYREEIDALPLYDAYFMRYALRLYDGTVVKVSAPILIMPQNKISNDTLETSPGGFNIGNYLDDKKLNKVCAVLYPLTTITQFCVEVAMRFYNLQLTYDFSALTEWKDIIKSVDIFMSLPLNVSGRNTYGGDVSLTWGYNHKGDWQLFCPTKEITTAAKENIENTSELFLIKSITDFGSGNFIFPTSNDNIKTYDVLATKELLKDEAVTHTYGAEGTYMYNKRLHLYGLTQTYYPGFRYDQFAWSPTDAAGNASTYNGSGFADAAEISPSYTDGHIYLIVHIKSIRTSESIVSVISVEEYKKLFSSAFLSYPDNNAYKLEVAFKDSTMPVPVKIAEFDLKRHSNLNLSYYYDPNLLPIEKQTYGSTASEVKHTSIDLKDTLMVSGQNNPFLFKAVNMYVFEGSILSVKANKLNVTDRNYGQYPLYVFTTDGPWMMQVGTDEVVYSTIMSPTAHVFPLSTLSENTPYGIAFIAKRGVYLINGQQTLFLSEVIENSQTINLEANAQIDKMVKNYSGKNFVEYCTGATGMLYNHLHNELVINKAGEGYMYVYNFDSKMWYISTEIVDGFVQNDSHNGYCFENFPEGILPDGSTGLETTPNVKQYLKSYNLTKTETVILNTPNPPVVGYSYPTPTHISFVTRPMMFGTQDAKRLARMVLRGLFYGWRGKIISKKIARGCVAIYDSIDGVNFRLIKGIVRSTDGQTTFLPPAEIVNDPLYAGLVWKDFSSEEYKLANLKDIDSGLFTGVKSRYIVVVLGAVVDAETQIQYIDTEIAKEYDNEKME
jgi:hypothetical protein